MWSPRSESNGRPSPYGGVALPAELLGRRNNGAPVRTILGTGNSGSLGPIVLAVPTSRLGLTMSFDQTIQELAQRADVLKAELEEIERASALLVRLSGVELMKTTAMSAAPVVSAKVKQTDLADWVRSFLEHHEAPVDGAELLQRLLEGGDAELANSARSELPKVLESEVAAGRIERRRKTRLWSTDIFSFPTKAAAKVQFNVR